MVGDKISREIVDQDGAGFQVKPLAKFFDSLLSSAGLEKCNPVHSLGLRSKTRALDKKLLLGLAEHKQCRAMVGKLMFLAAERPDIQFCVKECARGVGNPSARTCRGQSAPADISWAPTIGH